MKKALQPTVSVRLATLGDEATVSRLLLEAFEPYRGAYTPGGFADTTASEDVVRERFEIGRVWLAFDGNEALGTVTALPDENGGEGVYVRSMAVTPTAQGRGVGQKLLEALETDARARGEKRLHLYTTFVLPGAQPLYEKNGFVVMRETAPAEWHDMGGVEMEKKL
ncbi:MAG TPA: GNAT family N-acetyltransferase [Pyrinomonadaceae bacterium]|nr:GNAT family N-acetyltransferase [Pyrinomonadaceae bacterium]